MEDNGGVNGLLSTLYHNLRARRRREVIRVLRASTEPVLSVRMVAKEIAAAEHQLPLSHATGEPYRNAYNALSQTHLPTLAEAGVVIYDPQRQLVSRGPYFTLATVLAEIDRAAIRSLPRQQPDPEGNSQE